MRMSTVRLFLRISGPSVVPLSTCFCFPYLSLVSSSPSSAPCLFPLITFHGFSSRLPLYSFRLSYSSPLLPLIRPSSFTCVFLYMSFLPCPCSCLFLSFLCSPYQPFTFFSPFFLLSSLLLSFSYFLPSTFLPSSFHTIYHSFRKSHIFH